MKKMGLRFIIIISLITIPFLLSASKLTIRLFDNSNFDIIFNNTAYKNVQQHITFSDIKAGNHRITIYKHVPFNAGSPRLLFDGNVTIRHNREIFAVINRHGRFVIESEFKIVPKYYAAPIYAPPYMSEVDFMGLKSGMKRLGFDSSKLSMAKQAISQNMVTAYQVKELMMLLSFESSRLELAKFAFPYTYDTNRYFLIYDAFSFSSSIRSLEKHLAMN